MTAVQQWWLNSPLGAAYIDPFWPHVKLLLQTGTDQSKTAIDYSLLGATAPIGDDGSYVAGQGKFGQNALVISRDGLDPTSTGIVFDLPPPSNGWAQTYEFFFRSSYSIDAWPTQHGATLLRVDALDGPGGNPVGRIIQADKAFDSISYPGHVQFRYGNESPTMASAPSWGTHDGWFYHVVISCRGPGYYWIVQLNGVNAYSLSPTAMVGIPNQHRRVSIGVGHTDPVAYDVVLDQFRVTDADRYGGAPYVVPTAAFPRG